MAIKTMPECSADTQSDHVKQYLPESIPTLESDLGETEAPDDVIYYCPYTDCPRHHDPYKQPRRWREHLVRRHKLNSQQVAEVETRLLPTEDSSPVESPSSAIYVEAGEEAAHARQAESIQSSEMEILGGVHVDGFLRPIEIDLGRGRDVSKRRNRSTSAREGSKKRRER